jgi:hypothetical protein
MIRELRSEVINLQEALDVKATLDEAHAAQGEAHKLEMTRARSEVEYYKKLRAGETGREKC